MRRERFGRNATGCEERGKTEGNVDQSCDATRQGVERKARPRGVDQICDAMRLGVEREARPGKVRCDWVRR